MPVVFTVCTIQYLESDAKTNGVPNRNMVAFIVGLTDWLGYAKSILYLPGESFETEAILL